MQRVNRTAPVHKGVEQDVGQAMKFADHLTCMLEGRVVLEGRPKDMSSEQIFAAYFGV